jgi:hypothetical protein
VSYLIQKILEFPGLPEKILADHPKIFSEIIKLTTKKVFKYGRTGWQRWVKRGWLLNSFHIDSNKLWPLLRDNEFSISEIINFIVQSIKHDAFECVHHLQSKIPLQAIKEFISDHFEKIMELLNPSLNADLFQNYLSLEQLVHSYIPLQK